MKIGGNIIVFTDTGRFAAFERTMAAIVPMKSANTVDPTIKYTGGIFSENGFNQLVSPILEVRLNVFSTHSFEQNGQI